MKKISLLLLLCFTAGVFSACSPRPTVGVDSSGLEPFVIGGIGPLTEEYAPYGNAVKNGAQMAVDEINATGGVNGFRLVLNFQDSEGDPDTAVTVYEKLKTNEMKVLLGGVLSAETAALTEKAAEDGILTVIPTAGDEGLLQGGDNLFRVCPDHRKTGEAAATFLADRCQAKNPAVLYCDDAFGNLQIAQSFLEACNKKNVFTTEIRLTANMSEADLIQVFSLLAQESYDGIFLALSPEYLPAFFTSFDSEKTQVLTMDLPKDEVDCEGVALLSSYFPTEEKGVVRNFTEAYQSLYEESPHPYAADAYDAVYALAESIRKSGLSPEKIDEEDAEKKLLDAMTKISVKGVTGTLAWTTDGESTRPLTVKTYEKGVFVPFREEDHGQKPLLFVTGVL